MSIREEAARERKKLKQMTWRDKLWYIWEYYKLHIAGVLLLICLLGVVCNSLYRQSFTTRLSFCVINDETGDASSFDQLEAGLKKALNCGKKDLIEINAGLYASYGDSVSQFSYATIAKISAMVAGKDLDVMIADKATIDHYGEIQAFADLRQLLPPELYRTVEEDVYSLPGEDGSPRPVALSLEHTAFHQETGVTMEPAYLAVLSNSERTEAAVRMIRYLFP